MIIESVDPIKENMTSKQIVSYNILSTAFAKLGINTIHHIDITFLAYSIFAPNADFN